MLNELIQIIVGERLDDLNLACEMMMFSFGNFELHAQCFTRILLNHEVIVTTSDYQSWDEHIDKNNDEWFFVSKFKEQIVGRTVLAVSVNQNHDVIIKMDNNVQIELFIANGFHYFGEEHEQWVFFNHHDRSHPFITVYNKEVDIAYDCK